MTQPSPFHFHQLVPGLDFMQNLMQGAMQAQKNAGHASPLGNWITPTLSIEDLDRRLSDLKTVLFWLEQNTHAVKTTIQALEVQRLTLSALSSMNVNLKEMAQAFRMPSQTGQGDAKAAESSSGAFSNWPLTDAATATAPQEPKPARAAPGTAKSQPASQSSADQEQASQESASQDPAKQDPARQEAKHETDAAASAALTDPMNWWGSLTRQFQALASTALQQGESAAPGMAGLQAAQDMVKTAQTTTLASVAAASKQAGAVQKAAAQAAAKKPAGKTAAKNESKTVKTGAKVSAKSSSKRPEADKSSPSTPAKPSRSK